MNQAQVAALIAELNAMPAGLYSCDANGSACTSYVAQWKVVELVEKHAALAQQAQEPVAWLNPEDFVVAVVFKQLGGFAPVTAHGVRVTHKPSRISVVVDSERSQHRNRQLALEMLRAIIHHQAHPVPAPVDERAEFEACAPMAGSLFKRRADDPDKYWDGNVQDDWELWQARAALQSPAPQTKGQS